MKNLNKRSKLKRIVVATLVASMILGNFPYKISATPIFDHVMGTVIINEQEVEIVPPHDPIRDIDGTYILAIFSVDSQGKLVYQTEQEIIEFVKQISEVQKVNTVSTYQDKDFGESIAPRFPITVPERQTHSVSWSFTNQNHQVLSEMRMSNLINNTTLVNQHHSVGTSTTSSASFTAGLTAQVRSWLQSNFGFTFNSSSSRTETISITAIPHHTTWVETIPIHTLRRGILTTRHYNNMGFFSHSTTTNVEVSSPNTTGNGSTQVTHIIRARPN
ncbi:MAG: hypothetical protein FWE02_06265 [Defluviitaleaceae bacterium]|nr:hypothetical protein [Defluviitaleaceae bacterium]